MTQQCSTPPPFGEKFMQEFLFGPPEGQEEKIIVEPVPEGFCEQLQQAIQRKLFI